MIQIACPWCEQDAPLDPEQLLALGGRYTCAACQTIVELVEEPEPVGLPLAA